MPPPRNWTPDRILDRTIETPSGCREWQGAKSNGYGKIFFEAGGAPRVEKFVHRMMYELVNGPIPEGMIVRHSCDNTVCVNPAHLLLGDHADNARDRFTRRRSAAGSRHGMARLTEAQVLEIKLAPTGYGTGAALARKFGVSRSTISAVRSGQNWK